MKNKIIKDIKTLEQTNPKEYKELKQEFKNTLAYQSTDDEGRSHKEDSFEKENQKINFSPIKEKFKPIDKWNNSEISNLLEQEKFNELKELLDLHTDYNNTNLLKQLASNMTDASFLDQYGITENVSLRIFSEARDQLNLIGENITDSLDVGEIEI
jgi:hypothetical protein